MKKEFVPYELAVKLKALGFDELCLLSWNLYTHEVNFNGQPSKFTSEDVIQLPTFSQAFRWFREKYDFYVVIKPFNSEFSCIIWTSKAQNHIGIFKTYEEAELACLLRLIEIVETKTK